MGLIRLLMWLLLIYIGYRIVVAMLSGKKKDVPAGPATAPDAAITHRDPVCGVYVSEDDAVVGRLNGQRHYFCSMACLEKFRDQVELTPHS